MVHLVTWLYHLNTGHPCCLVFRCSVFRWLLYSINFIMQSSRDFALTLRQGIGASSLGRYRGWALNSTILRDVIYEQPLTLNIAISFQIILVTLLCKSAAFRLQGYDMITTPIWVWSSQLMARVSRRPTTCWVNCITLMLTATVPSHTESFRLLLLINIHVTDMSDNR